MAWPFRKKPEERSAQFVQSTPMSFLQIVGLSGPSAVGMDEALGVPAVWAAVNFLSGTIAGLPLHVYDKGGADKKRVKPTKANPIVAVLHDAVNDGLASFQWRFDMMMAVLTEGRAVTYIERDDAGLAEIGCVIVTIGARSTDAPVLIIGAHYDTAGASPGADDNASGVAALLELAAGLKEFEGRTDLTVELVFFANEEPPHFKTKAMGSFVHSASIDPAQRVVGMISLESLGYYSDEPGSQNYPFPLSLRYPDTGNFVAFVGDTSSRSFLREIIGEFRKVAKIPSAGGTAPSIVQGIDWSDHWAYSHVGIPAFMVTDTAVFRNPNYHRKSDTHDTLDYRRLALVVEALEKVVVARAQVTN